MSETLEQRFERLSTTSSDINEHLRTLYNYASRVKHITEVGTRHGVSTTAFLMAQPSKLVCYDIARTPDVDILEKMGGNTQFEFRNENILNVEIEHTDLLFIDSRHNYEQMKAELSLHSMKVGRYIIMHDTTICERIDEVGQGPGIWKAVWEFLQNGIFIIREKFDNNCGLTILERKQ